MYIQIQSYAGARCCGAISGNFSVFVLSDYYDDYYYLLLYRGKQCIAVVATLPHVNHIFGAHIYIQIQMCLILLSRHVLALWYQ